MSTFGFLHKEKTLDEIHTWLSANESTVLIVCLVCLLLGLLLSFIGRRLRVPTQSTTISAKNGSVVVGKSNFGTISTGGIGYDKTYGSGDLLTSVASWFTILGSLIAIVGLIVAILTWRFPVQS